jgi:hypothetical protein
MANRRLSDDTRNLARCATCAVMAEADCRSGADGNIVCATCGMPMVEAPSERDSYFEVIMRLGRPGPAIWPLVAGKLVS